MLWVRAPGGWEGEEEGEGDVLEGRREERREAERKG